MTPRDYAEAERRISRGPCGGWHWNGWDRRDPHRWHACAACVRLGNLTGESLTAIEDRLGLRSGRDFRREVAA